jgi:hypothetical protein
MFQQDAPSPFVHIHANEINALKCFYRCRIFGIQTGCNLLTGRSPLRIEFDDWLLPDLIRFLDRG